MHLSMSIDYHQTEDPKWEGIIYYPKEVRVSLGRGNQQMNHMKAYDKQCCRCAYDVSQLESNETSNDSLLLLFRYI
jgi:hypothetical protein